MTPEERSMGARAAAYALHAKYGSKAIASRARSGFYARFERQVDPNNELPEAERQQRASMALKQHMTQMALASAKARKSA